MYAVVTPGHIESPPVRWGTDRFEAGQVDDTDRLVTDRLCKRDRTRPQSGHAGGQLLCPLDGISV